MGTILQDQVDTIRQSFGYIREYRNALFVIKIDSALTQTPLFPILIRDVVLLHNAGIKIVLVPGTRMRINEILQSFSIEYQTINGIRVTTEEAIPFVKMAAFDVSNKLMTLLAENSANAVIGNWIRARGVGIRDGVDYQSTGMIDKVDGTSIRGILEDNMIPLFPNIGWSLSGKPYNINSNELALRISAELGADKLFFITESEGICGEGCTLPASVRAQKNGYIPQLTAREAEEILKQNRDTLFESQDLQLVSMGCQAIRSGVRRVHIINGHIDGVLLKEIFSNKGLGTMIYTGRFEDIRKAEHQHIPDILKITEPLVTKGTLIPRSYEEIETNLAEYVVYEVDSTLHGSGALKKYSNSAEIYSIAVDTSYGSMGVGRKIISYLIKQAVESHCTTLFLLTTQTTDWFIDRGFREGTVADLPPEKQKTYNFQRKSKVLLLDISQPKNYIKLISPEE